MQIYLNFIQLKFVKASASKKAKNQAFSDNKNVFIIRNNFANIKKIINIHSLDFELYSDKLSLVLEFHLLN